MAIIADVSIPAAELYLLRFGITKSKRQLLVAQRRFRPLLEFANLDWTPKGKADVFVVCDRDPVAELDSTHFNLIQQNAAGFGQLFVWFPPRTQPSGDESRLLIRAGIHLNFVAQRIGVYNRRVSKYNC